MDQRLQEIVDNFDRMKIEPDAPFKFHCTQCGKCCINREDILLNPFDLFRASKELGMTPKDFVDEYCDSYLGESSRMPIVRLMPRGTIKRCPLMRNRKCSIHKAKPTICAMFPIGRVLRMEADKLDEQQVTAKQIEYIFTDPGCGDDSETHTVRDWFGTFGIPLEDEFFVKWNDVIVHLGSMIRECIEQYSINKVDDIVTLAYVKLYLDYDTSKEFLPQFEENTEFIQELIKLMLAA